MLKSLNINIEQQFIDHINHAVQEIVDEEFERAKERIDKRRREIYNIAALEMTKTFNVNILGEDIIYHVTPKI